MARVGMKRRSKRTTKSLNAELELIIEEFGNAMRRANKAWIGGYAGLARFTSAMQTAWMLYVEFCYKNPTL